MPNNNKSQNTTASINKNHGIWNFLYQLLVMAWSFFSQFFIKKSEPKPLRPEDKIKAQANWNLVRNWARSGLSTPGLYKKISSAEKLSINLLTPIPHKAAKPNLTAYQQYRDRLLDENQIYADAVLSKLDKISFKDLLNHLKAMAKQVNELVKAEPQRKVFIMIDPKGSEGWIANLIYRYLDFTPAGIIDKVYASKAYDFKGTPIYKLYKPSPVFSLPANEPCYIVLFDDGSYSGLQLTEHLDYIYSEYGSINNTISVILSYAYATHTALTKAQSYISELDKKHQKYGKNVIDVQVFAQKEIQTIKDINWGNFQNNFDTTVGLLTCNKNTTLVYTDWKTPDNYSSCAPFFKAIHSDRLKQGGLLKPTQDYSIQEDDSQAIIPEICAPYKRLR